MFRKCSGTFILQHCHVSFRSRSWPWTRAGSEGKSFFEGSPPFNPSVETNNRPVINIVNISGVDTKFVSKLPVINHLMASPR